MCSLLPKESTRPCASERTQQVGPAASRAPRSLGRAAISGCSTYPDCHLNVTFVYQYENPAGKLKKRVWVGLKESQPRPEHSLAVPVPCMRAPMALALVSALPLACKFLILREVFCSFVFVNLTLQTKKCW